MLALSHKTNKPLFLFWTEVFLNSLLWLSYALPSLLIFLIFLRARAVITVLSSAFTGSCKSCPFHATRSCCIGSGGRLINRWLLCWDFFVLFCFDIACIISHLKLLLLYGRKNPLTWHWQRKQSLKGKKKTHFICSVSFNKQYFGAPFVTCYLLNSVNQHADLIHNRVTVLSCTSKHFKWEEAPAYRYCLSSSISKSLWAGSVQAQPSSKWKSTGGGRQNTTLAACGLEE